MRAFIATFACLFFICLPSFALAAGPVTLHLPDIPSGQLKKIMVEVLQTDVSPAKVVYQEKATEIATKGLDLPAGTYALYIEDEETGLILPFDNHGKGFIHSGKGPTKVTGQGFAKKLAEIKDKDKSERQKAIEKMSKKKPATLATNVNDTGWGGADSEDFIPGDLLIKYKPATTLAERYRFLTGLAAESRNKVKIIEVYRVRVDEQADLEALIKNHASDSRISYIEMNRLVSIPEPVEERDTRK